MRRATTPWRCCARSIPDAELIANPTNPGFGRANNQALPHVRGRYVLLLNTDAFVSADTLPKTVTFMDAHPECGVLGVKLVGEDGALQPSCRYFPTPWNVFLASTGLHRFFPWNPSRRRHGLGPRLGARVRLGARLLLSGAARGDRPRSACSIRATSSTARRWTIAARCAAPDGAWSTTRSRRSCTSAARARSSAGPVNRVGRQISALQIESELLYFRKHHGVGGVLTSVFLTTWAT